MKTMSTHNLCFLLVFFLFFIYLIIFFVGEDKKSNFLYIPFISSYTT